MSESWFSSGLRFSCSQCGDCCTGEPGAVWVNQDEIDAIARHLDMDVEAFEHEYVRKKGIRRSLYERFDGDCIFFDPDSRGCRVYPVRPVQCKTWPFWDDNLTNADAWGNTCEVCPGAGEGRIHTVEDILRRVAERREARSKL